MSHFFIRVDSNQNLGKGVELDENLTDHIKNKGFQRPN